MVNYCYNSNGDIIMDGSKTIGILIIVALILSIAIVGVNSYILNYNEDNGNPSSIVLNEKSLDQEAWVNGTNVTEEVLSEDEAFNNTTMTDKPTVNLNIRQKVGGVNVAFTDSDNIYNITSSNYNNSSTTVNYVQNGKTVDVNMSSNSAGNVIMLSNKYNYNIKVEILCGGFTGNFSENSRTNNLDVDITLGGVNLNYNGGKVDNTTVHVTAGGVNVYGSPSGYTKLNSEIKIGGMNVKTTTPDTYVRSNIELGGAEAPNYQYEKNQRYDLYKASNYDVSENKLDITSNVQIGGINLA